MKHLFTAIILLSFIGCSTQQYNKKLVHSPEMSSVVVQVVDQRRKEKDFCLETPPYAAYFRPLTLFVTDLERNYLDRTFCETIRNATEKSGVFDQVEAGASNDKALLEITIQETEVIRNKTTYALGLAGFLFTAAGAPFEYIQARCSIAASLKDEHGNIIANANGESFQVRSFQIYDEVNLKIVEEMMYEGVEQATLETIDKLRAHAGVLVTQGKSNKVSSK